MTLAGRTEGGSPDCELIRQLCDSYGTFQGMRLLGTVTLTEEDGQSETKKFRYTIGYRETINHLPPMSIEHLVPNKGEPHIADKELAHEWSAFDGERTGSYQRAYVASGTPARRWGRLSISPGYVDVKFRLFVDCFFHVGPVETGNDQVVGLLPALSLTGTIEDGEQFQAFPTRRLTMVADDEGVDTGLTISVAVGKNPYILGVSETHGRWQSGIPWLLNREVFNLEECAGYLLPTHVKWSQTEYDPRSIELVVDQVERIDKDFHGLWNFDSATGTRLTDQIAHEMKRIPFTNEEEQKISDFLGN